MSDLADWAWLVVLVVWFGLRALGKLFRVVNAAKEPDKADAEPQQRRLMRQQQDEKLDDVYARSLDPIEPK